MGPMARFSPQEHLYVYSPLRALRRIRTIHLLPATSSESPLRCYIQEVGLWHADSYEDNSSTYEAISYTWGEPKFNHTLYESRQETVFRITQSLSDALRCFRLKDRIRVLWADAVCINQADNFEKSSQIPLMGDIYRQAEGVLVWIGNDSGAEAAMKAIGQTSRAFSRDLAVEETRQSVEYFDTLLGQPWFSRRWIIQEVIRNHDVKFHCGSSSLSWIRLIASVIQLGEDSKTTRPEALIAIRQMRSMWNRMAFLEDSGTDHTLLENFHAFDHFKCGDPRDRIFALATLSSDVSMSTEIGYPMRKVSRDTMGSIYLAKPQPKERVFRIIPDYNQSVRQVYISFAAEVARNGLFSWLLLRTWHRQPSNELPAWAPDWQVAAPEKPFFLRAILDGYGEHQVWAPQGLPFMADWPRTRVRDGVLRIRGMNILLGSRLPKAVERGPPEGLAYIRTLWKSQAIKIEPKTDPQAWSKLLVQSLGDILARTTKRSFEGRDVHHSVFCLLVHLIGCRYGSSRGRDDATVTELMQSAQMPTDAASFQELNGGRFFICSQGLGKRPAFFLGFAPMDFDVKDVMIRPQGSVDLGIIGRDRTVKLGLILREQNRFQEPRPFTKPVFPLGSLSNLFKLQGQSLLTELQRDPAPFDSSWTETMVNKYEYDFDLA